MTYPPPTEPGRAGPVIFISAAEPSADRHGASLISAVRNLLPNARFVGIAGPSMVAVGCEAIFDMTPHSAMLLSALGAARRGAQALRAARVCLRNEPVAAAVVIDSPTLHLPLAARAKSAGVPVLYYIAPQMWAWGAWRIGRLRRRVDRVAVILPFEQGYFRDRGVDATYVGHPLADQLASETLDTAAESELRSLGHPLVGLLPGSRRHVVREVLPGQLEVAERIAAAIPSAAFGVSVANEATEPVIRELVSRAGVAVRPCPGRHAELIRAADLVLVASGTTTLEVALRGTPMIVMYNASRLMYHLVGRWLVKTPHLSLPNILAGREIVPEFMPYYSSTEPIAERALELLGSEAARRTMTDALADVTQPLREPGASDRVARLLVDIIEDRGA